MSVLSSPHLRWDGNQPLCGALEDHRCWGHALLFFPILRKQPQLCTFSISQSHADHYCPSDLEDAGFLSSLCESKNHHCGEAHWNARLLESLSPGGKVSVLCLFQTSQRSTCHRIASIPSATLGMRTIPILSAFIVRWGRMSPVIQRYYRKARDIGYGCTLFALQQQRVMVSHDWTVPAFRRGWCGESEIVLFTTSVWLISILCLSEVLKILTWIPVLS